MAAKNAHKNTGTQGRKPRASRPKTDKLADARAVFIRNAELLSRQMLTARLGMQFNGDRDLYSSFGYVLTPNYNDYRAHYDRQGMATRAVEIFSDDTWNKPPILVDGDVDSSMSDDKLTPFLKEWNSMVARLGVWQIMRQADIMCGIGRYSIIFMGAPGDSFAKEPDKQGLFYLAAFDERQAMITEWVKDPKSEKFGMPQMYTVLFNGINESSPVPPEGGSSVHFSRVIHVSENRLGSRVYGRPRLQTVLNRLFDLEKVTGGAAEAVWLSMYKGLVVKGREGASLPPPDSEEGKFLDEQVQNYVHRLQRYLFMDNADVDFPSVDEIRVKETYDLLIEDYAGSLGIPKRILVGSERGELASSQDMRAWNGVITSRRTNFAEPEILNPFVNWCIAHKAVPAPKSGKFTVKWNPVYELNELEQADVALKIAQAADALSNGMGEDIFSADEVRGLVKFPPRTVEMVAEADAQSSAQEEASAAVGAETAASPIELGADNAKVDATAP